MEAFRLLIVTGMSGAGKTQVLQALEDMGYLCIDNIPPVLIPKLSEICRQGGERTNRVALVVDIRGGEFFEALSSSLDKMLLGKRKTEVEFKKYITRVACSLFFLGVLGLFVIRSNSLRKVRCRELHAFLG